MFETYINPHHRKFGKIHSKNLFHLNKLLSDSSQRINTKRCQFSTAHAHIYTSSQQPAVSSNTIGRRSHTPRRRTGLSRAKQFKATAKSLNLALDSYLHLPRHSLDAPLPPKSSGSRDGGSSTMRGVGGSFRNSVRRASAGTKTRRNAKSSSSRRRRRGRNKKSEAQARKCLKLRVPSRVGV